MPVRIPGPRSTEVFSFGVAGVGVFAPFYMLLPGAEERLASQTAHWAPRWERNINYFVAPAEHAVQRVTPHVERNVKQIDRRVAPHLERNIKMVDRNIKKGIDRISPR
jgi:hypothetical protein